MKVENDPRFAESVFWVRATHQETFQFWAQYHNIVSWTQDTGLLCNLDFEKNKPTVVSVFWNIINGQRVLFYEATSLYVDYSLIEKWVEKNCKATYNGDGRRAHTDAGNFHHCFRHITKGTELPVWYIIESRSPENLEVFVTRNRKQAEYYKKLHWIVQEFLFDYEVMEYVRRATNHGLTVRLM